MRRISYAQNGEDIVLARAFAEQKSGFYIDVGAADPRADSVTKLFYDQGWHGINIEPQLEHWQDLERERPRDVNLLCGLGAEVGRRRFVFNRDIPGWSTFSEEFIARYEAAGMALETHELEIRTLADVWREHVREVVDFLKIDVEGFEREVLLGADWARHRPRVVVVEATQPERWEALLLQAEYREVLFDGLNRFYVRHEDEALVSALSAPANVMDDYLSWVVADQIAALEARVKVLDHETVRLDVKSPARQRLRKLAWRLLKSRPSRRHAPAASGGQTTTPTEATGHEMQVCGSTSRDGNSMKRGNALSQREPLPLPPMELVGRVGASPDDPLGSYLEIARTMMDAIVKWLPEDRPLVGARILDFGCGAGRLLRYLRDIPGATLHGCDIHAESIDWVRQHMPDVNAFANGEWPPLPLEDSSIDVVCAASVFTHLDENWSAWLCEMHRILDTGGVLVASFLASGMSWEIANEEWDENRVGMNVLMRENPWEHGGPSVLLAPWWIREHWGRGFDILVAEPHGFGAHGVVVARKRDSAIAREEFEKLSDDPREIDALRHNIDQLHAESLRFRRLLEQSRSPIRHDLPRVAMEGSLPTELPAARAEIESLRQEVALLRASRSWRVTRPLRAATRLVRRIAG